ncbi:MAG: T9SS type A sorting domain-containing protein [Janthinobacterium lividum]
MQRSSFLRLLGVAAGLLSASAASAQTVVPFTAGNFVVVRIGDGTTTLTAAAAATALQEYTPAGTLVQTVALPTADAGTALAFTETGSSTTDASLTRSADGRYLVLTGYNAIPGTATLAGTAASANNRLIARVASDGTVNTSTRITDAFSGSTSTNVNIRGAASANGSTFYAIGSNSGVVYVPLGNTAASTAISTGAPTNIRTVNVVGGNLYISSSSGTTLGVAQVGTGLPTTTGQAITPLAGFPTAAGPSSYSFFFTDQSATVPGPDVVYVADDRTTTDGGIQKWSLVGTSWVLNGTITGGTAAVRGLTGSVSGTTVRLLASSASSIYTVTDNAGYNVAPSTAALPAAIATAAANYAFRGIAPAPLATALAARLASALELGLYPNPATDKLTVELPGTSTLGHTVEVRDLLGRTVRTASLSASGEVNLTGLHAGTYLLTVDGNLTRRITKID